MTTASDIKVQVQPLIDAMNERMLMHRAELDGDLSTGYEDERYNGLPTLRFVLRDEYRDTTEQAWRDGDTIEHFSADTPFLGATQEAETRDALFYIEVSDEPWCVIDYAVDPARVDEVIEWVRTHGTVHTDDARADDLARWQIA